MVYAICIPLYPGGTARLSCPPVSAALSVESSVSGSPNTQVTPTRL